MFFRQILDTDKNTEELRTDFLTLNGRVLKFADTQILLGNFSESRNFVFCPHPPTPSPSKLACLELRSCGEGEKDSFLKSLTQANFVRAERDLG